jgi:hypothetical protein
MMCQDRHSGQAGGRWQEAGGGRQSGGKSVCVRAPLLVGGVGVVAGAGVGDLDHHAALAGVLAALPGAQRAVLGAARAPRNTHHLEALPALLRQPVVIAAHRLVRARAWEGQRRHVSARVRTAPRTAHNTGGRMAKRATQQGGGTKACLRCCHKVRGREVLPITAAAGEDVHAVRSGSARASVPAQRRMSTFCDAHAHPRMHPRHARTRCSARRTSRRTRPARGRGAR